LESIDQLSISQKFATITNAFMLVFGCHQDIGAAINLTSALQTETSDVLLNSLVQQWSSMAYLLQEEPIYGKFEEYMEQVLTPILSLVGWNATNPSNDSYSSIRQTILFSGAYLEVPSIIQTAQTLFNAYIANSTEFPLNNVIKPAVYWSVIRTGGEIEYNQVMQLYLEAIAQGNQVDVSVILQALSASKDVFLCSTTIQLIEQSNQTTLTIISQVAMMGLLNINCRFNSWKFIESQLDNLIEEYGEGEYLQTIPDTLLTFTFSDIYYGLLFDYFNDNSDFYPSSYITTTLKKAQINLSFIQCNAARLSELL